MTYITDRRAAPINHVAAAIAAARDAERAKRPAGSENADAGRPVTGA